MSKKNKFESGFSSQLMSVQAESIGRTLLEIICTLGLPNDVTLSQMVDVLQSPFAEREFKKFVLSKANEIARTDEEKNMLQFFNNSRPKIVLQSGNKAVDKEKSNQAIRNNIDEDTLEALVQIEHTLASGNNHNQIKIAKQNLKSITDNLLTQAGKNLYFLAEIFVALPYPNPRTPYLEQELFKFAKTEFNKGNKEKIEELFFNEKFLSIRQKLGMK